MEGEAAPWLYGYTPQILTGNGKNKSDTSDRKEKNPSISIAGEKFFSDPWRKMSPNFQEWSPCGGHVGTEQFGG